MLKGRSLKSCVVLVVFCFSLVVVCISPAWATTTVGSPSYEDANGMTIYAGVPASDPIRQGQPISLPIFDVQGFGIVPAGFSNSYGYNLQSLQFQPFSYDVSLVLGFTVIAPSGGDVSGTLDYSKFDFAVGSSEYFRDGFSSSISGNYPLSWSWVNRGYVWNTVTVSAPYGVVAYRLPAGTNGFRFMRNDVWSSLSVTGKDALLSCVTAYVVHSGEQKVIDQVNAILEEVKKVNGSLTDALSVLNQILVQCQGIKADTSSIVSILGLCKDQLVTLNGKVNDIYILLKDSLANETQALDQKSQNVAGQIMQRVDAEQFWTDKNTENFGALDMGNWTFGDGVVGALPTVGNLFKSLWDSIGDATLIFVFPLMLGIALVIVGRLSRTAGKGSKKGGGDDG